MANVLSVYDPISYANEALIQLEKALGLAGRVHRGYDKEPRQRGSVISIRKPSVFTAQDAPGSDMDINAGEVQILLNKWKEVKFALTDKELSETGEIIIDEHIRPAAYALADQIDTDLATLYADIPWFYDANATTEVQDITQTRKVMFDNSVPLDDPNMVHLMVDGALEAEFLALNIFHNAATAGQASQGALLRGNMGTRFGLEIFANQNTPSHVKGTCDDPDLLTNGTPAKGATSLDLDAASVTGTLVKGDTFVIAGNTQRYAVTALNTASSNAFTAVAITPGLAAAPGDGAAVTVSLDSHVANMAFHRNFAALATAPLSDLGNAVGANIGVAEDPITQLSLRSRLWYDGDNSTVKVGLDVLYGYKTLDGNLANRLRS